MVPDLPRLKQEFANPGVKCDNVPELTVPLKRDTAVEWARRAGDGASRSDARENRERILEAASRLLAQSPAASLGDVAAAAGVSRSTLYRHFTGRKSLIAALGLGGAVDGEVERHAGLGRIVGSVRADIQQLGHGHSPWR